MDHKDQSYLDNLFDQAIGRLEQGEPFDIEPHIMIRPHLKDELLKIQQVALRLVRQKPLAVPTIEGYEILHELGRGAMGVVYLAKQLSLGNRLVALKVLPTAHALSYWARNRFKVEARALGRLQHPNVVSIHDVILRSGLYAYSMDWIEGKSLLEIIKKFHSLKTKTTFHDLLKYLGSSTEKRPNKGWIEFVCSIGVSMARALEESHQVGLLHRDVKPSNILVRKDGVALLTDFGLVRSEDNPFQTQSGIMVGTPAYASPEQLRGEHDRMDQRSDIYGLGATLYQSLAFALPYPGKTPSEILKRIEDGFVASIHKTSSPIPKDLETIVTKAMDPDPINRYKTASALADDLERFLNNQPILARPPSAIYRFKKLVSRHKAAFGILGLFFAFLMGFSITMTLLLNQIQSQSLQIKTQRDKAIDAKKTADMEAKKARQTSDIIQRMFTSINPALADGRDVRVRDIFMQFFDLIKPELDKHPELEADISTSIGLTFLNLNMRKEAKHFLNNAFELNKKIYPKFHSKLSWSHVHNGDFYLTYHKPQKAMFHLDALKTNLTRQAENDPMLKVHFLHLLGRLHALKGEDSMAISHFQEAISACPEDSQENCSLMLKIISHYAQALHRRQHSAEGERLLEEAQKISIRHFGEHHHLTLSIMFKRLNIMKHIYDPETFDPLRSRYLDLHKEMLSSEYPLLFRNLINLARYFKAIGDSDPVRGLLEQALKLQEHVYGPDSKETMECHDALGWIYKAKEEYEDSRRHYCKAYELHKKHESPKREIAKAGANLASLLYIMEEYEEAEKLFSEISQVFTLNNGTINIYVEHALCLKEINRHQEAMGLLKKILAYQLKPGKGHAIHSAGTLTHMVNTLIDMNDYIQAKPLAELSLSIKQELSTGKNPSLALSENLLGQCLVRLGEFKKGKALISRSTPYLLGHESYWKCLSKQMGYYNFKLAATYQTQLNQGLKEKIPSNKDKPISPK